MSSTLRTDNKFDQFPQKGPFREFSVVYTDRVYNLMSPPFQKCMKSISQELKEAYSAAACVLIPGSGTYAMEAVARQFGLNKKCMIIRNGFFSFRWTDINKVCLIFSDETVLMIEGCLSYPELFIKIKRPTYIVMTWENEEGNKCYDKFAGMTSRIIQHEVDHLEGITFLQKANRYYLEQAKKALKKVQRI